MFLKSLTLPALGFGLLGLASAASLQKRQDIDSNVNLLIWADSNYSNYITNYSFAPGACQAVTASSVGSATVDSNATCNVYASSDCSGTSTGTLQAPGNASIDYSFGSVSCSVLSSSGTESSTTTASAAGTAATSTTTSSATTEPTDVCEA